MNYWINMSLIFVIIGFVLFIAALRINQKKNNFRQIKSVDVQANYTLDALQDYVKKRLTEITTIDLYTHNLSEEEFKRRTRRRQELKDALKNCNNGDINSKVFVREYIIDLLKNELKFNEENINWPIPFDNYSQMSAREKFEALLYVFSKKHGNKALGVLLDTYQLAEPKSDGGYRVLEEEIHAIYKDVMKKTRLTFEDKLRIITQMVYSHYKGFGVIDEIRDQRIDGVSGGVSGLPKRFSYFDVNEKDLLESLLKKGNDGMNSVWIMYQGKSIHLSFLSFEHESELRRVVTNVYKYGHPGQLSETNPYIINEMYDGSRVTVVRPKFSESWAFFIRKKYDAKSLNLNEIIHEPNKELPINLLKFMMKGNRTTAITGAQGSGKTTLLMALINYIHPALNLRIQETSFEVNLRSLYSNRNILSFQETDAISGQDGLDLQKKTDGHVTILGEVATDPVAAWMIQSAQVASLFTIFTHHAKTFKDLVHALRNSLLKIGVFHNESIAEQQVVSVLEFDIHMKQDYNGNRYIERITECIPIEYQDEGEVQELITNAASKDEKMDALIDVMTIYFRQQTQRKHFIERNIIEYRDGDYVAVAPISEKRQQEILEHLTADEQKLFKEFIQKYWGEKSEEI